MRRAIRKTKAKIYEIGRLAGGVEYIELAQGGFRWRALVNAVFNLWALTPRS
jgi:hypothetical protein